MPILHHCLRLTSVLFRRPIDSQAQAIQLRAKYAELGSQVPHQCRVAKRVVRLPRTDDHAIHLVDEAFDDDAAIFLALYRGEVDREFAPQSKCISRLASSCPRGFEDRDGSRARQSRFRHGRTRPCGNHSQCGNHVPS
jgi:hypothetical protein